MKPAILLTSGLLLVVAAATVAAPRLSIPENEFDFGFAPQNSEISHVFWLHAEGDEVVKITDVKPGCGCTQAPLANDLLNPGDSTRLEIIFSTLRYSGRVNKGTTILVEGSDEPYVVSIASYVVTRPDSTFPVRLKPYKLDISQYGEVVRDRAKLTITNVSDEALKLKLIDGFEDYGALTLPKNIAAGESLEAELVLIPSALTTSFKTSFTFELNDEQSSRFTVPVLRKMKDPRVGRQTAPGGLH